MAFGLIPSNIKSIAIPNDLQEWPTSALAGCTALEKITVYGEEVSGGTLRIGYDHGIDTLSMLTLFQFPSTVLSFGSEDETASQFFPPNIQSVFLPKGLIFIPTRAFTGTNIKFINWNSCTNLRNIWHHAFRGVESLSLLNLESCSSLTRIGHAAFYFCNNLRCVVFPPSLRTIDSVAFEGGYAETGSGHGLVPSPVQTIIWKGRTDRSNLGNSGIFHGTKTLDTLVQEGEIQEIFLP